MAKKNRRQRIEVLWMADNATKTDVFTAAGSSVQLLPSERRGRTSANVQLVDGCDEQGVPVLDVLYRDVYRILRRPGGKR